MILFWVRTGKIPHIRNRIGKDKAIIKEKTPELEKTPSLIKGKYNQALSGNNILFKEMERKEIL